MKNKALPFFSACSAFCAALAFSTSLAADDEKVCCLTPPNDLVGWWPGDFNANDIAGPNSGSFGGAIVAGKVKNAFGTTNTDFVTIPSSALLEPPQITVDLWVKAQGPVGNFRYILDKGASSLDCAGFGQYAFYTRSAGGLVFYFYNGTHLVFSGDAGPGIWDNRWHFITGTYDPATTSSRLYVDGVLVPGTVSPPLPMTMVFPDRQLYFGDYPQCVTADLSFTGSIDEVEIFSRVLSLDEIQAIYQVGSVGKCKPLPKK